VTLPRRVIPRDADYRRETRAGNAICARSRTFVIALRQAQGEGEYLFVVACAAKALLARFMLCGTAAQKKSPKRSGPHRTSGCPPIPAGLKDPDLPVAQMIGKAQTSDPKNRSPPQ